MTVLITPEVLVRGLARAIRAGEDAQLPGDNKDLNDAFAYKNFTTGSGSGGSATTLVASVTAYGATGNGTTDDTTALRSAIASGSALFWPAGEYRITGTLVCTTAQSWTTNGRVTIIYDAPAGSPAIMAIDFRETVKSFGNFVIDHQAHTKNYADVTGVEANIIRGSAVIVQGDYSSIDGWEVKNAWDNGIAAVRISDTGVISPGLPKYGSFRNIKTQNCGCGYHPRGTPGLMGGGIDIGSGSAWVVSDCVDNGSRCGFILDLSAGAQAAFSNCIAYYTKVDTNNPTNGSGTGFYIGSNDSTFIGCHAIGAGVRGWWVDNAIGTNIVGCTSYISGKEAMLIKKGNNSIDLTVKYVGYPNTNTHDAVIIDSTAFSSLDNIKLTLTMTDNYHRYAVSTVGANPVSAYINGTITAGGTGKINPASSNHLLRYGSSSNNSGTWQEPAYLGNSCVWVDTSGRMRIKASLPTYDMDGAVVGSQA